MNVEEFSRKYFEVDPAVARAIEAMDVTHIQWETVCTPSPWLFSWVQEFGPAPDVVVEDLPDGGREVIVSNNPFHRRES